MTKCELDPAENLQNQITNFRYDIFPHTHPYRQAFEKARLPPNSCLSAILVYHRFGIYVSIFFLPAKYEYANNKERHKTREYPECRTQDANLLSGSWEALFCSFLATSVKSRSLGASGRHKCRLFQIVDRNPLFCAQEQSN
jgi:hypothetical protein